MSSGETFRQQMQSLLGVGVFNADGSSHSLAVLLSHTILTQLFP